MDILKPICYTMSAIYYWTLKREVVFIKKNFYLASNFDVAKGKPAIDDLNNMLECVGVHFKIGKVKTGQKIFIEVNEDKLRTATNTKAGRPIEHEIDFEKVQQLKADGKTNKEIYTELGISKSLFYLKMREYKNNIGQ